MPRKSVAFNKRGPGGREDAVNRSDRRYGSSFFSQREVGMMEQVVINKDNEDLERKYRDMQFEMDE